MHSPSGAGITDVSNKVRKYLGSAHGFVAFVDRVCLEKEAYVVHVVTPWTRISGESQVTAV